MEKEYKENKNHEKEEKQNYCHVLLKEFDSLWADKESLMSEWQEIAELIVPYKSCILKKTNRPSEAESKLFDTTAQDCLLTAAGGLLSWTTPKNGGWFSFGPTSEYKNNLSVRKWLLECTEKAEELLSNSNFYTQRHESLIDKLSFGISALYSSMDENNNTYFENLPVGTYVVKENQYGIVDYLARIIKLTPVQALSEFEIDALPEKVKEQLKNNCNKESEYVHVVKKRDSKKTKSGKLVKKTQKPFESVYIHRDSKIKVKESGYDSFPFHVGRWLNWNGGVKGYGYGPGYGALPEARQLNFYQKLLDVYAEKTVYPPMMVPDSYEGTLNTNARGINYYSGEMGPERLFPLELTKDVNVALERIEMRKNAIKSKFFTDLWTLFAQRTQQKTATEVLALQEEKIEAISPAFDRDVSEVIIPMMNRLFEMWGSEGLLPPPPQELIQNLEGNFATVPNPAVTMTGKLALALKNIKNKAGDLQLQRLLGVASIKPEVLDVWNWDSWAKTTSFYSGVDSSFINSEKEIEQIRTARAQAQQQQMMMQNMIQAAKAAGPENTKELVQKMGM